MAAVSLSGVVEITGGNAVLQTAAVDAFTCNKTATLDTVTVSTSLDSTLLTQASLPVATQKYVNDQIAAALLSLTFTTLSTKTINVSNAIVFGTNTATGLTMTGAPITMGGGTISMGGGTLDMGSGKLINVPAPSSFTDAANKAYVDTAVSGIVSGTQDCDLATDDPLPSCTFNTVVSTLTAQSNGALVVDTISATAGMRVLVRSVTGLVGSAYVGVYDVTSVGSASTAFVLTRSSDFNTVVQIYVGKRYHIRQGAVNALQTYICNTTLTSGQLNTTGIQFQSEGTVSASLIGRTRVQALSFIPLQYNNITIPAGNILPVPSSTSFSSGYTSGLAPSTCFILNSSPSTTSWTANLSGGTQKIGDVIFITNSNAGAGAGVITILPAGGTFFVDGTGTTAGRLTFGPGQSGLFIWTGLGWTSVSNGFSAFAS